MSSLEKYAERYGGKYEFCRLPFGLKNASIIFQRTIDDSLTDEIGKTFFVNVDNVIIFSETAEGHVKHVDWVLKSLYEANMRVSIEKSVFFKQELECHCFIGGGKPITMISRTLRDKEIYIATNERELLTIVWALKSLRNYLYGVRTLNIFTDHQPLTFAVSDRNSNAKIKRWKALIDEHNANLLYKPGKENYVADALSR